MPDIVPQIPRHRGKRNEPKTLELVIEYTNCTTSTGYSTDQLEDFSYPDGSTQCHLTFSITENYTGDVKFYYGLREFYQNNRMYVVSRNDLQLLDSFQLLLHGELESSITVPFTTRNMISERVKKRKFRNPVLTGNQTLCDAFRVSYF
ncbi:hypothetical protein COOONC_12633 [Cooperia oncophora]